MFRVRKGKLMLLAASAGAALPSFCFAQAWTFSFGGAHATTENWATPSNWTPNTVPNSLSASATFNTGPVADGDGTVNVPGLQPVGSLHFNGNSGNGYTVSGTGTLSLPNGATIEVIGVNSAATITTGISAPTGGVSWNKDGGGTLFLGGTSGYTNGEIHVAGGTLAVMTATALTGVAIISTSGTGVVQVNGITTGASSYAGLGGTIAIQASGNNTWNGAYFVVSPNGGVNVMAASTLNLNGFIADGFGAGTNGFTVSGAGQMNAPSIQLAGPLSVLGTSKLKINAVGTPDSIANTTTAIVMAAGAKLDLTNNKIIDNYGTSASPQAAIKALLLLGRGGGTWNGTAGITSSTASAGTANFFSLAYADGADGVVPGLLAGNVEIAYTVMGDVNMDGHVNGTDYSRLLSRFGLTPGVARWDDGDLNYDGFVNGTDYSLLLSHFGNNLGAPLPILPASLGEGSIGGGLSVPEPTFASVLGLGIVSALGARRRRNANTIVEK